MTLETNEIPLVWCKNCGVTKERVMAGKYPNGKDKRWVCPITRKQWSGAVCSECVVEKSAARKRAKSRSKNA